MQKREDILKQADRQKNGEVRERQGIPEQKSAPEKGAGESKGGALDGQEIQRLTQAALAARMERADVRISGYAVGAALLTQKGEIFSAGNIECFGQTPSICAERVALFKALSEGEKDFRALAVCGGPKDRPLNGFCYPCGVCRQVLTQFCPEEMPVICMKNPEEWTIHPLRELLPFAWRRESGGPCDC